LQMLVESIDTGPGSRVTVRGTTCRYAPAEMVSHTAPTPGDLIEVTVDRSDGERLHVTARDC